MSFCNTQHIKKTRRARQCDWCFEKIEKGNPAVYTAGVFEGDFYSARYHPECNEAIHRYCAKYKPYGGELPYGPMNRGGIEERGEPEGQS